MALTALIRRFAGMVVVCSGGIHAYLMFKPMPFDEVAEYAMRGRTAANIPHAEEQNTESA